MRGRFIAAVVFLAACLLAGTAGDSAEARGLTIKLKASEAAGAADAGAVELYKASHALVIGIDDYTAGWPRLSNAVKDAELVASALRQQGFAVSLRRNLKGDALRSELRRFFGRKGRDGDARLFLWFAGHGYSEGKEGFLVPADAPGPESEDFYDYALHMRDFGGLVRLARSKHVYAVFDSCFSGTIFSAARTIPPRAITRRATLPVRQFLTSGDAGQMVSDDGTFRKLFVRSLRGEERADLNGDGYLTASELGMFISDRVTNLGVGQTHRYGKLRDPDFDRGDFVFALARPTAPAAPQAKPSAPPTPGAGMTAEMMFWQSMKDSTNPADFEDYLAQFPRGTFARLAKRRMAALNGRQSAALRPAPKVAPAPPPARPAVGVYPQRHKPGDVFKDCPECPEMVVVPAGSFRMGDLQGGGHNDEKPVHKVTIPRPFGVGKYEVTQGE